MDEGKSPKKLIKDKLILAIKWNLKLFFLKNIKAMYGKLKMFDIG
jgi:hypothetical protein